MKEAERHIKPKRKWYQESTFKRAITGMNVIAFALTVGVSAVDHSLYITGFLIISVMNVVVIGMTYLLRNNP